MDVSRDILDSLLGRDRNKTANQIKMKDHYSNKDVCKPFLICFCFHTLFPNTAYDDGPCKYKHDPYLKNMFDHDMNRTQYERKYLIECIDWIERRIADVEVRVKKNKEMIDIKSNNPSERPKQIIDRLMEVDAEIEDTVRQAQTYASNGQIFDSERCMNDIERLKQKKKQIELMGDSLTTTLKLQKICEVCGAIQVINDTQKRIQTHLEGKIHQGFLKLRHQIQTLKVRLDIINSQDPNSKDANNNRVPVEAKRRSKSKSPRKQLQSQKNKQKERERERQKQKQKQRQRQRQREKERQKQKDKNKDRDRDRDRDYDDKYRNQNRDKKKDRDREKDYDRPRDKQQRHKHRDDKDRDRHKDKSRSRDRKDKRKDIERGKDRRDRSGSHHRKKHKKDSYD